MTAAGFVGAHPEGLESLARFSREAAQHIRNVAGSVPGLIAHRSSYPIADIVRPLLAVAVAVAETAESLEWRATAIQAAEDAARHGYVGHHGYLEDVAHFAANAVFDLANWRQSFRMWNMPPDIGALAGMPPPRVGEVFARLAPSVAAELADEHPGAVGHLDGVPPQLRYRANRILIQRHVAELEEELSRLGEASPLSWVDWIDPRQLISNFPHRVGAEATIEQLHRQVNQYRRWLDEERQILLFEPGGDGRVAEVFGDLDRADHIAVVVPGIANDKTSFGSAEDGGLRANAAALYEAAAAIGPGIATIAWLGYDTPDGIDAGLRHAAESGAPALRRFIEGLDPRAQSQVAVVAHSYGSLVAGLAAVDGLAVDDLVFIGSPGTGLGHASDAQLRPGGRVWVGLTEDDPITAALAPSELSHWRLPAPFLPGWLAADLGDGPETLWHGANPAGDSFGAVRFGTAGSSGHSGYFAAGSLHNLARIVQGRYRGVDLIG